MPTLDEFLSSPESYEVKDQTYKLQIHSDIVNRHIADPDGWVDCAKIGSVWYTMKIEGMTKEEAEKSLIAAKKKNKANKTSRFRIVPE